MGQIMKRISLTGYKKSPRVIERLSGKTNMCTADISNLYSSILSFYYLQASLTTFFVYVLCLIFFVFSLTYISSHGSKLSPGIFNST